MHRTEHLTRPHLSAIGGIHGLVRRYSCRRPLSTSTSTTQHHELHQNHPSTFILIRDGDTLVLRTCLLARGHHAGSGAGDATARRAAGAAADSSPRRRIRRALRLVFLVTPRRLPFGTYFKPITAAPRVLAGVLQVEAVRRASAGSWSYGHTCFCGRRPARRHPRRHCPAARLHAPPA